MSNNKAVTKKYFLKRLVDLCLRSGLSGFPKNETDQHIMFKSAVLTMGDSEIYTEKEINDKLKYWIENIGQIKDIDHITLRRRLIDTGYLTRNNEGSCYQIASSDPGPQIFAETINPVDIIGIIKNGKEEIARRKREYLEKSGVKAGG